MIMNAAGLLKINELSKSFEGKVVLDQLDLEIQPGEFVVVLGPSGSGKTTLFKTISGLVVPESGSLAFSGQNLLSLTGMPLRQARREIGFVFQQFNLIKRLTALQNVLAGRLGHVPLWRIILRHFSAADIQNAISCLFEVGLADIGHVRADRLSGGQQQRVAIARSLAQRCRLILADEPVASLDPENARAVLELLRSVSRQRGLAVLCSLHQVELTTSFADRIVGLAAGRIAFDLPAAQVSPALLDTIYIPRRNAA